jgi:integrase
MFDSARASLTDHLISSIEPPREGERRIWDLDLTGFMVRMWPSGRKVFCLRFRRGKRIEMHTIGKYQDPWSTEQARDQARCMILRFTNGRPTAQERKAGRGMTVEDLCDRYLSEGHMTKITKRPGSWKTDTTNLRRHVIPLIGQRYIRELTRPDIAQMVRDITDGVTAGDIKTKRQGVARVRGGAGSAARVKTTLSAMFNWAILYDYMDKNPACGIKVANPRLVERFLSDAEAARLMEFLSEETAAGRMNAQHANVIRMLMFTGARKMEILGLRWSEVNLRLNRLEIPPERTKCGLHNGMRRIPLGSAAKKILISLPRESEFVFPADRTGQSGHLTGIQKAWVHVRNQCGLGEVRLHDLRHTFASFAITNGESIYMISKVLGHSTTRMTERYLHLSDEDVRGVAERTVRRIVSGRKKHQRSPFPSSH